MQRILRLGLGLAAAACLLPGAEGPKAAVFSCDATPDLGEPNIWVEPVKIVLDPLYAKGVVLEAAGRRYVIAAIDWCGIGGSTDLALRTRMAKAAGTEVRFVALQSVHQHAAPYIEGDAYRLLAQAGHPLLRMSDAYLEKLARRLEEAVGGALKRLEPFDRVGTARVEVERAGSERRLLKNGRIVTRYSSTAKNPELAAEPEGDIDRDLRTVTLARGAKPLVRLHYYASHPQTFCCDGRVSADFVGAARARREQEEGVPQIYFTGGGGNVTVGKYNTGKDEEREALARRMEAALRASAQATRYQPAGKLEWRYEELRLPPRAELPDYKTPKDPILAYRAAIAVAFAGRTRPLPASALHLGGVSIVHLPGEPLLEFQRFAQNAAPDRFVAFAGYGDMAPGYLVPDEAHRLGGYEPSASNTAPGAEARIKEVLKKLLSP
jgi:hypothetical protein